METITPYMDSEQKQPPVEHKEDILDKNNQYDEMDDTTKKVTDHLAAAAICQPDFPLSWDKKLEEPPPFTNYGYQMNFNPIRYYSVIWSVIEKMIQSLPKQAKTLVYLQKTIFCVAVLSLLTAMIIESSSFMLLSGVLFIVGWKIGGAKTTTRNISAIKANALQDLLTGAYEPQISNDRLISILGHSQYYGHYSLDKIQDIPVLIVKDEKNPFPGFGRFQMEEFFIFPTQELSESLQLDNELIMNNISFSLQEKFKESLKIKKVLSIDGNSIGIDSDILDENKVPKFSVSNGHAQKLIKESGLKKDSCRIYHIFQLEVPEHANVSNLFLRLFSTQDGVSCHVALTTIGPLAFDHQYFNQYLSRHKFEKKENTFIKWFTKNSDYSSTGGMWAARTNLVLALKNRMMSKDKFQKKTSINDLVKFKRDKKGFLEKYFDRKEKQNYEKERARLLDISSYWPGFYNNPESIRDNRSLTFSHDFYGRFESMSETKLLYKSVIKALMNEIEASGYDVSEYKKDGEYIIKADKIDQIVVGKEIKMESKEK